MLRATPSPAAAALCAVLGLLLATPASALFFYLEASTRPICFYEELPRDTLVVGNYTALMWSHEIGKYTDVPQLGITITVDETFNHDHRIVNSRGAATGKYTFTAAENGVHRICFSAANAVESHHYKPYPPHNPHAAVKFSLDTVIGETSKLESNDKGKLRDIVDRVKDLNNRLVDIKREQAYQREREAEFRDQSESTNARVVRWCLIQLAVLGATCVWQLSHLRAFFIKQKLT